MILLAGIAFVGVGAFTGWQALQAKNGLQAASADLGTMRTHLADGDLDAADAALKDAQDGADAAYTHTRGPVWWALSKLPLVGDDVTAVREVSAISHGLADGALADLMDVGQTLNAKSLTPAAGKVNLRPLAQTAGPLRTSSAQVSAAAQEAAALETEGLLGPVKGPVEEFQTKLDEAAQVVDRAATAAALMPAMLGKDGPRTYLVVFQNNAEVRSLGGMPGALAVIRARNGKVELVRQGVNRDLGSDYDPPVLDLSDEEEALYTEGIGRFPQLTVSNPDFPRAAQVLQEMWRRAQGQKVDGVLSMDPVAMAYLLRGTGPVQAQGQTLTAQNAVDMLLRDSYLDLDAQGQDALYADTARALFDKVSRGQIDPTGFISAATQAVEERRILLWSRHDRDQRHLADTAIAGQLPDEETRRPNIAVFLNDSASDKLSYYLDYDVDVTPTSCTSTGAQIMNVRVTLASTVPKNLPMPPSLLGPGIPGVAPGTTRTSVYLYAPVGGRVDEVRVDGEQVEFTRYAHRNRGVSWLTFDNARGENRVLEYRVFSGPDQTGTPTLTTTPLATTLGHGTIGESAC